MPRMSSSSMHASTPVLVITPSTLPPEEMEYYRGLQEQDEAAADQLPEWLQPRDAREKARIKWLVSCGP
ncbi:hypothetical protein MNEG_16431 [Monoraphidium neglectum]|uniref:Uncharacterized protein n=1 Tax=Monoraphidium neglectum TaxID=145388 RepID=A0A0D2K5T5_9CHLO|nr:hypothetical protein MNEG_16431 [Monoraphidium neglectum]KIY91533.1 hypothetical protein MNEG_16431 [Monoraphidium neglectum]|eukprot:XP_013890553.1 hypothetical protein MNEG_16431 [Monoraphidium neglectum]